MKTLIEWLKQVQKSFSKLGRIISEDVKYICLITFLLLGSLIAVFIILPIFIGIMILLMPIVLIFLVILVYKKEKFIKLIDDEKTE